MWFMGASLPSGRLGVVSPSAANRLRHLAQAQAPEIHPQADDAS
jgi:hypothetical protein